MGEWRGLERWSEVGEWRGIERWSEVGNGEE